MDQIPQDRVRYHISWGSWHGPYTHDFPLEHVIDLMLRVRGSADSVEAASPRHEWAKLKALAEGAAPATEEL
jgi:5-methyltetrahydropteroyltriglutamate--homocysteine methyltransferase